ncbi:MAG TPA: molybdenum cofactor guanylyltransferase [Candidatus Eisenbacteria bacterium]
MEKIGAEKRDETTAVILCGGNSRRFGRDKAAADHHGQSLLDHVLEVCGVHADQIILACGRESRYASLGLTLALDAPGSDGPLAGIDAGLKAASHPSILIVAVDLAGVNPRGIEMLREAWREDPTADLVLPRTERGVEPLLCVGRREPLRAAVATLIATSDPAPRRLPEFLKTRFIDVATGPGDPLHRALTNINTPQDLAALDG